MEGLLSMGPTPSSCDTFTESSCSSKSAGPEDIPVQVCEPMAEPCYMLQSAGSAKLCYIFEFFNIIYLFTFLISITFQISLNHAIFLELCHTLSFW